MPIAYSYKRFSSDAQEGNDSIRRQTAIAKRYIDEHPEYNLTLDTTLSMTDAGVSAFKGKNLKTGSLGQFVDAVRSGLIPEGSWLLLESLDRFTRQAVNYAAGALLGLINEGIVVVTLTNGTIYREDDFNDATDGLVKLLGALIAMNGHHQEQVTKGKRIAEAWKANYAKLDEDPNHVVTKLLPFWISPSSVDGERFTVLEDKVSVVRRIFQDKANGLGKTAIANALNAEGVPPPKNKTSLWHPSSVEKVLRSEAVVGTLINKHEQRFEGYYPQIIDEALYQEVKALNKIKAVKGQMDPAKVHPLTNLAVHSLCGKTLQRVNKGAKGSIRLACNHCKVWTKYDPALNAVMNALFFSQYQVQQDTKGDSSNAGADAGLPTENDINGLSHAVDDAFDKWRKSKDVGDRLVWEELTKELRAAREQLREFQATNTQLLLQIEDRNLKDVFQGTRSLRTVVKSVTFDPELVNFDIVTLSGRTIKDSVLP